MRKAHQVVQSQAWSVVLAAVLLAACSPLSLVNGLTPVSAFVAHRDIAYGPASRMKLDIYVPQARSASAPVVIFLYGGSWQSGSKDDYLFLADALTELGMIVVVPDYRLYPQARFPEFVQDAAHALAWVQTHIESYGGDSTALFLMGHSAGAHIAMLLALDSRYLSSAGGSPSVLRGVIGLAGPYDFLPFRSRRMREIFAPAADPRVTQPIYFAEQSHPPLLLLVGEDDRVVDPGNSERLAARAAHGDSSALLIRYPGLGHAEIMAALWRPTRFLAPVRDDIAQFIHNHRPSTTTPQGSAP